MKSRASKFDAMKIAALCVALVGISAIGVAYWPKGGGLERLKVEVIKKYPHDASAFTQGLEFHDNLLWESTGRYGTSSIRRVRLRDGVVEKAESLPREHFGEGLTKVGEIFVQLTWKSGVAYRWKASDFSSLAALQYDGEGWGLCFDGQRLVLSNGTDRLSFRDPKTMKETGFVRVRMQGERLSKKLNELECVNGQVYANAWREDAIYRIDPSSGQVTAVIDARALRPDSRRAEVLNGIAYNPSKETFFVTGKLWPVLYEVRFVPQ